MESQKGQQKPTKNKTQQSLRGGFVWTYVCVIFLVLNGIGNGYQGKNPHAPLNLTWVVKDISTGQILHSTSKVAPLDTWWPDLTFFLL